MSTPSRVIRGQRRVEFKFRHAIIVLRHAVTSFLIEQVVLA